MHIAFLWSVGGGVMIVVMKINITLINGNVDLIKKHSFSSSLFFSLINQRIFVPSKIGWMWMNEEDKLMI